MDPDFLRGLLGPSVRRSCRGAVAWRQPHHRHRQQEIGYATAAGLHASGATVVINGCTTERVQEALDWLGGGDRIIGITADVGTAAGCAALLDAVAHVDILVNNAGIAVPQPVLEISDSEWERLFAVNVMSGVRLPRCYLPGMLDRRWGRVVFVSSFRPRPPPARHCELTAA